MSLIEFCKNSIESPPSLVNGFDLGGVPFASKGEVVKTAPIPTWYSIFPWTVDRRLSNYLTST